MSVDQKKILIRQGNKADLVVTDMQQGEPVLALDTNEVGVKTSGGDMLWFATAGGGANKAVLSSRTIAGLPLSENISLAQLCNLLYPVGSIYMSTLSVNPGTIFGGTWVAWGTGSVLVGVDLNDTDFNAAGKTGGEKRHTLTFDEMPSHNHRIFYPNAGGPDTAAIAQVANASTNKSWGAEMARTSVEGGGLSHNNMPPYITCYMWQRTA